MNDAPVPPFAHGTMRQAAEAKKPSGDGHAFLLAATQFGCGDRRTIPGEFSDELACLTADVDRRMP
jgi:hypothetical protein